MGMLFTRTVPGLEALWQAVSGSGLNSVAITAADPGEGATTVAIALAQRAASMNRNGVLLVDAQLDPQGGVADQLGVAAGAVPGEILELGQGVSLMGAPSTETLAAWHEPARLIEQIEQWSQTRRVILDCAPLLGARMGLLAASSVVAAAQGTVLVVMTGVTPASRIVEARMAIERAGGKLIGVVMNDARSPSLLTSLLRETHRLDRRLPRMAELLRHRMRHSALLNVSV